MLMAHHKQCWLWRLLSIYESRHWKNSNNLLGSKWWPCGQHMRLLLWRSEFKSRWNWNRTFALSIYCLKRSKLNIKMLELFHQKQSSKAYLWTVWPDWAINWTLGNCLKPLATIYLPTLPTFLGNFCQCVKIFNFSSEIIFGQLLLTFVDFFWSQGVMIRLTSRQSRCLSSDVGWGPGKPLVDGNVAAAGDHVEEFLSENWKE